MCKMTTMIQADVTLKPEFYFIVRNILSILVANYHQFPTKRFRKDHHTYVDTSKIYDHHILP